MKQSIVAACAFGLAALTGVAQQNVTLKDQKDKASYSIGLNIGNSLKQHAQELSPEILAAGLKDALSGAKPLLTEKEVSETLMAFQRDLMAKQGERSEKNKKDGEAFLAENKKKEGIKTLASGLQYKVLHEGKGPKPKATDTVKTNYRGTLIDGTEFDASEKDEPVSFPLNGVIRGWTEALQLMPVGSKWQLFVPSSLAYAEQGQGPIQPNSTLIFEIELLAIEPPAAPAPAAKPPGAK